MMPDALALCDILGDLVVYRDLNPVDQRLPRREALLAEAGLPEDGIPRKREPEYSLAIRPLLDAARSLEGGGGKVRRVLFLGDTRMNDTLAARNLEEVAGLPTLGFICDERSDQQPRSRVENGVFFSNRWADLARFAALAGERGFAVDADTAIIVDIDKTALGARGRNHGAIDLARTEALRQVARGALGEALDEAEFDSAYDELNQQSYHPFTDDNQDYLAYISVMVGGGVYSLDGLLADLAAGRIETFFDFLAGCDGRLEGGEGDGLWRIHREVKAGLEASDPTPFKSFRVKELEATVARMNCLPDGSPLEKLLREEIVLTREVVDAVRLFSEEGAVLLAISDKPPEACIPSLEEAARGSLPLHRVEAKVVGNDISAQLDGLRNSGHP
jgi:hypothetical protein